MTIAKKLKSLSDKFISGEYAQIIGSPHFDTNYIPPSNRTADLLECEEPRGGGWGPASWPITLPADDGDGSLWTGYVDNEAIHPDRLHALAPTNYTVDADHIGGGGGHDCTLNTCNFTYDDPTYKYPWADPEEDDMLDAPDDCIK